jgi:hypothetical protein
MPSKKVSLPRGPTGEPGGDSLARTFWEKNDIISGFLSWTQRPLILIQGAIWNCGKGTGLSWADTRLWGTKGLFIRPTCIVTIRAQTQYKSIYLSIHLSVQVFGGHNNVVCIATHYWLDDPGFEPWWGQGIFCSLYWLCHSLSLLCGRYCGCSQGIM